ncbi:E2F-associated phosphoprotein isoform X2 [Fundulus heteroclitus]|uniref:E2F-associated phosphoprotein isoform X2 n=1 Tax=Fundulus heteroclitus TaxID=8078 RepID=UPI000B378D18|nr:E2F-associated phosphoprotein isoform X2 [Fundulus heteroclitus]
MLSSEDELDVLLNGTAEQKKKLIREYLTGESESSSEDEFEKEMETELSSTIRTMEGTWGPAADPATRGAGGGSTGDSRLSYSRTYDKVYFDSDSEEDTPSSSKDQRKRQRIIPTNDELLYDPDEDDRDQAWVDARRYNGRKQQDPASRSQHRQSQRLPSSDAVLNCPACMTTLCLDCQRHEKYRTQYRAMFVMNCTVETDEVLRYKTQQQKTPRKRRRGQNPEGPPNGATSPMPAGMDSDEIYHPVKCSECSTEVAVFDKDEVYHFFNILASHC